MTSKQDTTKLAIKYKPIGDLVPYARNSRTHSESQVAQIAASIKEFGWTNPVLLDGENGIIAGHGRVMAAQKLGEKQVPTIELGHLDEHQKRAYIIADNKLALNAGWDDEMLSLEISDLKDAGYDLRFTGFTQDEINQLGDEPKEGLTDEDAIPEVKDEPKTKHGNIYQLGDHILMCGDSTNEKDVAKLVSYFGDEHKHCISDPPYGIAYDPKTVKYGMIKNDDVFLDYIGLAKKYTNGFFFMWTSYQVVDEWINRVKQDFEKITNLIIWHKGGGGMGDCLRTLATDYEIAIVVNRGNEIQSSRTGAVWDYQKDKRKEFLAKCKKDELIDVLQNIIDGETVWKIKKDNTSTYLHPTQKPVEVNQRALTSFTKRGDVVIDLFLGSGSNLIACETLERKLGGMELDPHYCDVIVKRWEEFTGKKATLLNANDTV
jgi:DNA modification methylase